MTNLTGATLKMERTLDAPREKVFAALTRKDAIAKWFGPKDEFKVTVHKWDCRVGGTYRVEFDTPEKETHICHGEFREIVDGKKLAYTWAWEGKPPIDTLVTFVITSRGAGTHLTLTHEGFPAEDMRDHHKSGWTGSLERFERYVG